jgi:hypothetical protein
MRPTVAHLVITGLIAGVTALLVVGCNNASSYTGDGKLIDNGFLSATDRYVLDLGPVTVASATVRTYRIVNLPAEKFVIGISVKRPPASPSFIDARPINAVVAVELREENGNVLARREAPLKEWTWSVPSTDDWAFIYGEGTQHTFFTPGRGALSLTFSVVTPDPQGNVYAPVLVAKTGGWK